MATHALAAPGARLFRAAALLVLLAVAPPARAGELELKLRAIGFDLPGATAQRVRTVLTRMHAFYEDQLGLRYPDVLTVEITLYADRAAYEAAAGAVLGARGENSLGFFSKRSGGVVWRSPDEGQYLGTLVHEASHFLVAEGGGRLPRWLDEGLAEVFERFRVQGNAVWLDPEPRMLTWMHTSEPRRALGVIQILETAGRGWLRYDNPPIGDFEHGYGWALTAFLMASPAGKRTLRAIAEAYHRAGDEPATVDAAAAAYPGGREMLERDFATWRTGQPRAGQLPVRPPQTTGVSHADPCPNGILVRKGGEEVCQR